MGLQDPGAPKGSYDSGRRRAVMEDMYWPPTIPDRWLLVQAETLVVSSK